MLSMMSASAGAGLGGDATAMMMAAAKLATTATGPATTTKVDDVIEKKRSEGDEPQPGTSAGATGRKITAKERWNWAYNKIIMQLNVSRSPSFTLAFPRIQRQTNEERFLDILIR